MTISLPIEIEWVEGTALQRAGDPDFGAFADPNAEAMAIVARIGDPAIAAARIAEAVRPAFAPVALMAVFADAAEAFDRAFRDLELCLRLAPPIPASLLYLVNGANLEAMFDAWDRCRASGVEPIFLPDPGAALDEAQLYQLRTFLPGIAARRGDARLRRLDLASAARLADGRPAWPDAAGTLAERISQVSPDRWLLLPKPLLRGLGLDKGHGGRIPQPLRRLSGSPRVQRGRRAIRYELRRLGSAWQARRVRPAPRHRPRPVRILIGGWYGTETLGDKAILAGLAGTLRSLLGDVELGIASLHPWISTETVRQMPELAGARVMPLSQAVAEAPLHDLVMFGGGPIMAGDDLAAVEALFRAARRSEVPTLMAACGVGPLGGFPGSRRHLRRLIGLADVRIYRDRASRAAAAALGIDASGDLVAEDPAFAWLESLPPAPAASPLRNGGPRLLLGLRAFPGADYDQSGGAATGARYEAAILAALDALVGRQPDLKIVPVPMYTNAFGHDDRFFYRDLFERASPDVRRRLDFGFAGLERTPSSYTAAFRSADVALTMRYHALVFALGLGVPAVAIDYTFGGKVAALAAEHEVEAFPIAEIDADALSLALLDRIGRPQVRTAGKTTLTHCLAQALARLGFTMRTSG
ncbi:MAG: hypothetical protein QOH81_1058 [Sphingomonadales bacterium]|nr:hypothetical protein [Sphingomonadales bacterium]